MCLYPRLIRNRKYTKTKKNGGKIPAVPDDRVLLVPIGCQKCIECRQQRARQWQARLTEDIKRNRNGKFVTLTFSDENLINLQKEIEGVEGYQMENETATLAVRRFLEKWRKRFGKSVRHWLITELGTTNTERIHLHGILWTDETFDTIAERWGHGYVYPTDETNRKKNYVNEATVNYITKYITKTDVKHKNYVSKIFTSAGIGRGYEKSFEANKNQYKGEETRETYRLNNGAKIGLPIYYRNKIYTEEERERLWLHKLDKNERWVCGEKVRANDYETYNKLLEWHRERNKKLGYGDDTRNWNEEQYRIRQKQLRENKNNKKK